VNSSITPVQAARAGRVELERADVQEKRYRRGMTTAHRRRADAANVQGREWNGVVTEV